MDKEQIAIDRIRLASEMSWRYYNKPLICTYSGGKDSDVLLELFKRSGVGFEVLHSHTTVDAPPTVYHVREVFKGLEEQGINCQIHYPIYKGKRISMWTLIPLKKIPPTRTKRYCCQVLKEESGRNRCVATGVRKFESSARKKRETFEAIKKTKKEAIRVSDEIMLLNDNSEKRLLIEHCQIKGKMVVNPLVDWTDRDIWDFIRSENVDVNILYDMGYNRVGCVGCPLATYRQAMKEFADFPVYKTNYIKAFDRMLLNLPQADWKCGEEVFEWWVESGVMPGQTSLFK